MTERTTLVRAIGRWSLAALVINSIIGSGIFGLPSKMAGMLGRSSVLAYLIAGAGIGVIMACFAEVSSQFREAGGPYLYARAALGRLAGIQMAWLAWLVRWTSAAANANLFVDYSAEFWPPVKEPLVRAAVLTLLIGILALVNIRGVRAGAHLSTAFTVAKLVPLVLFIGVGLFFVRGANLMSLTIEGTGQWLRGLLVLVFAYGGFEGALLPLGEAKNPKRDAPFALFVALATCIAIYTLVHIVVIGVLPSPAAADRPLAAAARQFMGSGGAALITLGALISVYGYLSGQMLSAPRLTYALAEQSDFPALFGTVHRKFRTPHISILVYASLAWLLAISGSFLWNAMLSSVARLFTYGLVCLAVPVLRKRQPDAAAFRLPGGPLFYGLGIAFAAVLLTSMGRAELVVVAATSLIALVNWLSVRGRTGSD